MDLSLESRSALVLGSTSGLGLAIAQRLAEEGARVAFTGRRGAEAARLAEGHPGAIGLALDLQDESSVDRAVSMVSERFGGVDIVVLNSGGPPPGTAAALQAHDLAAALRALLLAQIGIVARLLPGMREREWGRIVAVGSSGVQQPIPNLVQSNTVRAALAGYLKTLSREVAADGVTVNMVLPGRMDTDRVAQLDAGQAQRQGTDVGTARRQSEESIPMGRYGTPREFADVAVFLCSQNASYVTGAQIRVDGGKAESY
jgi:3-oxoacyl-[acyl-carrier protein] reductase